MLNKICNKIELIHIVILIVIVAIIGAFLYMNSSSNVKKFNDEIKQTINIENEGIIDVLECKKAIKVLQYKIPKEYIENADIHNYITGSGKGLKINFKILISNDNGNNYLEAKTLKTNTDEEYIYLSACVKEKHLNEQTKFALFDVSSSKLYEF